jgi:ABC-type multidrug transport system fused ATPase/permease subunit
VKVNHFLLLLEILVTTNFYWFPRISLRKTEPNCVASYLNEWTYLNSNTLQCSSFSSDEYPDLVRDYFILILILILVLILILILILLFFVFIQVQNNTEFYTDCKKSYNIDALALGQVKCRSDEECEFGGIKNQCNRITGVCSASKEVELTTVRCILQSMDTYKEYYFKGTFYSFFFYFFFFFSVFFSFVFSPNIFFQRHSNFQEVKTLMNSLKKQSRSSPSLLATIKTVIPKTWSSINNSKSLKEVVLLGESVLPTLQR